MIDGQKDARELGIAWLDHEADYLTENQYPYTLSLLDVDKLEPLVTATDLLWETLELRLNTTLGKERVLHAAQQTDCFDSNQDGRIDGDDENNYCDLASFAHQLQTQFFGAGGWDVRNAAQGVIDEVNQTVIHERHRNGYPHYYPQQYWGWSDKMGGLAIFLPIVEDDWKRTYYNGYHFDLAENSQIDEFLTAYWLEADAPDPEGCPDGCDLPEGFLPTVTVALTVTVPTAGQVELNWTPVSSVSTASNYDVYRGAMGETLTLIEANVSDGRYVDTLPAGQQSCYQVVGTDETGQQIEASVVYCLQGQLGQFELKLSDQQASRGDTVLARASLLNADGLCVGAMDLTYGYDPTVISPTGNFYPTIYTEGYQFQLNTSQPGLISLASINPTCEPDEQLNGSGILVMIEFEVLGDNGAMTPLVWSEGTTQTSLYPVDDPFNALDLTLTNGSVTVSDSCEMGDVTCKDGVNSADALFVMRIVLGKNTVPVEQKHLDACDVNGDDQCTVADVPPIICYAAYGDWPRCLGGDVQTRQSRQVKSAQPVQLCVDPINASDGGLVSTYLRLTNGADMAGMDITLDGPFGQDETAVQVATTDLTNIWLTEKTITEAGQLRIAAADMEAVGEDGAILKVSFPYTGESTSLHLNAVSLNDSYGQDFVSNMGRTIEVSSCAYRIYLPNVVK
ncbi:cohesin domain-containing protein [Anaerolineales bacterium HSG24]|nr:cohesin domain-containing protein [Anaerolineales bacterium HSG24]